MKRKSILALTCAALVGASILLSGCGKTTSNDKVNNTADNGNTATQKLDDAGDAVKEGIKDTGDAIKYSAMNFKDDAIKAGYDIKDDAESAKDYFKGKETDYRLNKDLVRIYEYDNAAALDADLASVTNNGMTINGTEVYKTKPYYFRKGNSLILYEGSDPAYVDRFTTLYGSPVF